MSAISINPDQALSVYAKVFGEDGRDDRAASIVDHLRRVASASSIEQAEKVIAWWGCWVDDGGILQLRPTVRRLRRLLGVTEPR